MTAEQPERWGSDIQCVGAMLADVAQEYMRQCRHEATVYKLAEKVLDQYHAKEDRRALLQQIARTEGQAYADEVEARLMAIWKQRRNGS